MAGYYPTSTVWQSWNAEYSTQTAATTANFVWGAWNQACQGTGQTVHPLSQDDIAASQARAVEVDRKARELLIEHLDPAQRESYDKHGLFVVETARKNRYRLSRGQKPRKLVGEKEVASYCIHTHGIPKDDELLGLKLLLEANEDEFLKTANATPLAA